MTIWVLKLFAGRRRLSDVVGYFSLSCCWSFSSIPNNWKLLVTFSIHYSEQQPNPLFSIMSVSSASFQGCATLIILFFRQFFLSVPFLLFPFSLISLFFSLLSFFSRLFCSESFLYWYQQDGALYRAVWLCYFQSQILFPSASWKYFCGLLWKQQF